MIGLKNSNEIAYNGTENECRFELYADTAADLQGVTHFDGIKIQMGSECTDIATGDKYLLNGSGVWVLQPSANVWDNVYTKTQIDTMINAIYQTMMYYHTALESENGSITFYTLGTPVGSLTIYGNGQQTGTPTPDNPVMPTFCGVRTANLFDGSGIAASTNGVYVDSVGQMLYFHGESSVPGGRLNPLSNDITLDAGSYKIRAFGQKSIQLFLQKKGDSTEYYRFDNTAQTIRLEEQKTFFISCGVTGDTRYDETVGIVLVSGSTTPTSYVPYGWQIPLTCAGQTVPVYLGEVPTVRRVRKMVLTGTSVDGNTKITQQGIIYVTPTETLKSIGAAYCTHFKYVNQGQGSSMPSNSFTTSGGSGTSLWFKTDYATVANFQAYLASEYAAGHPVTIWYVLATERTGIVNEPLCKIGDYADELHITDADVSIPTVSGENTLTVDTTLPPSKIVISGE